MVEIETPGLLQGTQQEQLQQISSYLHRMSQQLQWAFDTLEPAPAPAAPATRSQPVQQESPRAEFSRIRDLIIRSAEIVDAYSAEISRRLEGVYVAQSEFGTYREQTSQTLEAGSQSLQQLFRDQEQLSGMVAGLQDQVLISEAYVRTGLLRKDETGRPVYGLEVGQRTEENGRTVFNRFARFTPDRLSFFDASDVEVAYISDYRLCITNADITGNLTLGGRFRVFSGDGLIFQWTGGEKHDGSL